MWRNMVEPGKPQLIMWRMCFACWITKATATHSEYVILLFRDSDGFPNACHCYVLRALPLVSVSMLQAVNDTGYDIRQQYISVTDSYIVIKKYPRFLVCYTCCVFIFLYSGVDIDNVFTYGGFANYLTLIWIRGRLSPVNPETQSVMEAN